MKRVFCSLTLLLCVVPVFGAPGGGVEYLALGDSITFGFTWQAFPPESISDFRGYPEIIANFVPSLKRVANLACPGQSSTSFWNPLDVASEPSNNCYGWRVTYGFPLHTFYPWPVSQMTKALDELASNPQIKLVTIMIGGNDLIQLEESCASPTASSTCFSDALGDPTHPGPLFTAYGRNLGIILSQLRAVYKGKIVLVTYYSMDYSDTVLVTPAIAGLNAAAKQVAQGFNVDIADAFTAFGAVALPKGGKTCDTGLLSKTKEGACDVHPSPAGQALIAATIMQAAGKPASNFIPRSADSDETN